MQKFADVVLFKAHNDDDDEKYFAIKIVLSKRNMLRYAFGS